MPSSGWSSIRRFPVRFVWGLALSEMPIHGCESGDQGAAPASSAGDSALATFGATALLPTDPPPPSLPPTRRLVALDTEQRKLFCSWIEGLERPVYESCRPVDQTYIAKMAVVNFCTSTIEARGVGDCDVSLEELAGCAVDVADCRTRVHAPKRCDVLMRKACAFEIFPSSGE